MNIEIVERSLYGTFAKRTAVNDRFNSIRLTPLTMEDVENAEKKGVVYRDKNGKTIDYDVIKDTFKASSYRFN